MTSLCPGVAATFFSLGVAQPRGRTPLSSAEAESEGC